MYELNFDLIKKMTNKAVLQQLLALETIDRAEKPEGLSPMQNLFVGVIQMLFRLNAYEELVKQSGLREQIINNLPPDGKVL